MVVESNDEEDKVWVVYDAGPKTVRCPLVFLPPVSGTADVFFKQLLALSSLGYRVMSVCIYLFSTFYDFITFKTVGLLEAIAGFMQVLALLEFDMSFQGHLKFQGKMRFFP